MNDNSAPPSARQAEMRERGRRGGYRGKGKQIHPAKRQMQEIARAHGPECIARLRWLMLHGETHAVMLAAANGILDRGFGKPFQAVGVDVDGGGGRMVVNVITGVHGRPDCWPDGRPVDGRRINWPDEPDDAPLDPFRPRPDPLAIEGKKGMTD